MNQYATPPEPNAPSVRRPPLVSSKDRTAAELNEANVPSSNYCRAVNPATSAFIAPAEGLRRI